MNCGDLGDLADTFGVKDIVWIQRVFRRLLQIVDGNVFQRVAVEIFTNNVNDAVAEVLAVFKQFGQLELLADGL